MQVKTNISKHKLKEDAFIERLDVLYIYFFSCTIYEPFSPLKGRKVDQVPLVPLTKVEQVKLVLGMS